MDKIPYILIILLINSFGVHSQQKKMIYGKVTTPDGKPLELVSVAIKNTLLGTTTDSNGNYELNLPSSPESVIVFSRLGSTSKTIVIKRDEIPQVLNVVLQQTATEIAEVKVQESKFETGNMERIDSKMTQNLPTASGNAVESLVMTQMGVRSNNELSSQYSVRGGNFDENLVYVNGIEVYRPFLIRSGQQEGLSFINPSMVSSISFSAGGFEAKYGDKMSSVLDITYRRPTKSTASAEVSLLGAQIHAEGSSKDQRFTQIHGFRYKTNQYLLGSLDTQGEYSPSFFDYQTYLTYRINKKWDIGFLGNFSQNTYQFRPTTRETQFGTYNIARAFKVYFDGWESDLFRTFTGALNLNYRKDNTNAYSINLSAFNTNEQEKMDIRGEYWINELDNQIGSETLGDSVQNIGVGGYLEHARNQLKASVIAAELKGSHEYTNHLLEWGVKLQGELIDDKINTWQMRDSSGYSLPYKVENGVNLYYAINPENQINSTRVSTFIQDNYLYLAPWGKVNINAGLRASYWSFNKETILSPRLAIRINPDWDKKIQFKLSAGIYYQSPFYKELRNFGNRIKFVSLGDGEVEAVEVTQPNTELNRDIKSQKSIQVLSGFDYYFKKWERPFKFSTEVYYKQLSNLIPYDVDNVNLRYYGDNMSEGYVGGFDMRLYGEFVPGIDSWITLSYLKTEENVSYPIYADAASDVIVGTYVTGYVPRPTDQRLNLSMFFQDYFPGNPNYQMNLQTIFGSKLTTGPPNGRKDFMKFKYPPYVRVDLGLTRRFLPKGNRKSWYKEAFISAEVLNLFNINNVNSYFWVQDIYSNMFAIPNYLTSRRYNLKLKVSF